MIPVASPAQVDGSVKRESIFNADFMTDSVNVINKSEYNVWSLKDKMTTVLDYDGQCELIFVGNLGLARSAV
jgi:hypothetical protein